MKYQCEKITGEYQLPAEIFFTTSKVSRFFILLIGLA